jgi:hypothetical protein
MLTLKTKFIKHLQSIGSVATADEYKKHNLLDQIEEVNRFAADGAIRGVTDFLGQINIEIRANLLASDVASKNNYISFSLTLKSQAEVLVALKQYV